MRDNQRRTLRVLGQYVVSYLVFLLAIMLLVPPYLSTDEKVSGVVPAVLAACLYVLSRAIVPRVAEKV
jgi:hypothetical protein